MMGQQNKKLHLSSDSITNRTIDALVHQSNFYCSEYSEEPEAEDIFKSNSEYIASLSFSKSSKLLSSEAAAAAAAYRHRTRQKQKNILLLLLLYTTFT